MDIAPLKGRGWVGRMKRDGDLGGTIGFEAFLGELLRVVPGRAANLYTPDVAPGDQSGFWHVSGEAPDALLDYMDHYRTVDVWAKAASRNRPPPTGSIRDTDRLVTPEALRRSEFYADYLRPNGIERCLVGIVDDGSSGLMPRTRLTVVRAEAEQRFSDDEIVRFEMVTRLARPLSILAVEEAAASRAAELRRATLDLVRMPILVVDDERRIETVNRSAFEMLRSAAPLGRRDGRLAASDPVVDRKLAAAIRQVAQSASAPRIVTLGIGRPGVRAPAVLISRIVEAAGPTVLVRVLEPDRTAPDAEAVLAQLLDLTPAECAVAWGLAEGLSHDDIARRRGVKVTTVRTTLRRVQEKLGIDRSARLARFIFSLTAIGGMRL